MIHNNHNNNINNNILTVQRLNLTSYIIYLHIYVTVRTAYSDTSYSDTAYNVTHVLNQVNSSV